MHCIYRLVKYLFDDVDGFNSAGFDLHIVYRSQSWLGNETKKFDDNREWVNPASLYANVNHMLCIYR